MSKKILITGGAGFVGSHLCEKYLALGYKVYVIDNLSTGSVENIKHLMDDESTKHKFRLIVDTIFNRAEMERLVKKCDLVIHLAAAVGVKYILDNPLESIRTNILGTELVLELCNKYYKKVLISSTSEAYGKQNNAPLKEDDDITLGPSGKARWSYAASKLLDEFLGLAYHSANKLPVVIVRFFNTVGPRQTGRYGMVVPRFVEQALANEALCVHGTGNQTRTFTHVTEVCESIVKLMECDDAVGQVVNIGGKQEVSILELAQTIIKLTDSSSSVELIPYENVYNNDFEDMPRRVPSQEKLLKLTGYAPSMVLNEILKSVIEHIRS
jgi:UDP-glucose 4-epimerase